MNLSKKIAFGIAMLSIVIASNVSAEVITIESDGEHHMSYDLEESFALSKDRARADAIRNAIDQATIYLKDQLKSLNYSEYIIKIIAENIIRIQGDPEFAMIPADDNKTMIIKCHMKVLIDDDDISKISILNPDEFAETPQWSSGIMENRDRLKSRFDALKRELESLREDPKHPREIKKSDEGLTAFQYFEIGLQKQNDKKYSEAIENYSKAIELDSNFAYAYINRGVAYKLLGYLDKAIEDFSKAIELEPKDADTYYNRGLIYKIQDKLDLAIADYDKAIELNPKFAEAYNNRGIIYYDQKILDKAIEDFSKAIELNPNQANAYNNRGVTYKIQGKLEQAIEDFSKAIEIRPDQANIYINRGEVFELLGKLDQAVADYQKAIELDPNNFTARKNLNRLKQN